MNKGKNHRKIKRKGREREWEGEERKGREGGSNEKRHCDGGTLPITSHLDVQRLECCFFTSTLQVNLEPLYDSRSHILQFTIMVRMEPGFPQEFVTLTADPDRNQLFTSALTPGNENYTTAASARQAWGWGWG